jgi:hypothetical protein
MEDVMALTCEQLDPAGCGSPNCNHDHTVLYLYARCHPNAGAMVSYDKRTSSIRVMCRRCKAEIAEVAVASKPEMVH